MPDYRVKRSKFTEDLPEIIELLADAVAGANLATRRRILDSATRGQRLLCGSYFYWDDVTNGGHWQYFWNYTGNLIARKPASLRLVDLAGDASVVRQDVARRLRFCDPLDLAGGWATELCAVLQVPKPGDGP